MEQNVYQQIQEIIDTSQSLDDHEKREFTELFAQTKENALRPVLKLFNSDSSWVEKLYKNYKMKQEAIVTGSMDAWRDAIQKEKEELERM